VGFRVEGLGGDVVAKVGLGIAAQLHPLVRSDLPGPDSNFYFQDRRLFYHSILGLRVIKKKKKTWMVSMSLPASYSNAYRRTLRNAIRMPIDFRGRANMAHVRQSRPDDGLGFHVRAIKTC